MFSLIKQAFISLVAVIAGIGSPEILNESPASFSDQNGSQVEILLESLPEGEFEGKTATSTKGVDQIDSPITIATTTEEIEQGGEKPPAVAADCASCVTWARQNSKMQPPRVRFAKEIPILYEKARIGSWVVFGGRGIWGSAGHTGLVRYVNPENPNLITFEGCNYPSGKRQIMTINVGDGKYDLLGFFDNRH